MKFTVLTLFPELIDSVIGSSITGRAVASGIFDVKTVNIRDYSGNKYGKVDDTLYGGGTGMLMMCEPIYQAWIAAVGDKISTDNTLNRVEEKIKRRPKTIFCSPKGRVFNQSIAKELAAEDEIILLCGHYEGIDQRVLDEIMDDEISIGDYVLTGGEIAACVIIDAVSRLIPGVLPQESAYADESHMNYALEHPQYTKPQVWHDREVPEVLRGGHHKMIEEWKRIASYVETYKKRPDLFAELELSEEEWSQLIKFNK